MTLPRFYVNALLPLQTRFELPPDTAHHAGRALRLKAGTRVSLFNGDGTEVHGPLSFDAKKAWVDLESAHAPTTELPAPVMLVQGLPAGDKMDWIIEKGVELGLHSIQPIAAQRSVLKLSGERLEKRLRHWEKVMIAACEQSGRNRLMPVLAPLSLADWLVRHPEAAAHAALCDPAATQAFSDWVDQQAGPLHFLVGPEGGWAPDETALASQHGISGVRFGTRVLRTETAGLALVSALSGRKAWV
ncbi:MAG: 16S rRNA (uracil(1498)-N(3))-methyltransferase [Pigmentiphaga sp.]|nr:16S rRNA (uracil(1498)-N(3))-methyltransferase [Pigmentiphaga sp.]